MNWKLIFGKENTEIIIYQDGKKHIADVKTTEGYILELQNSIIESHTIRDREEFYGSNMLWIINGKKFKDGFRIFLGNSMPFDNYSPEFDRFAKLHGFTPKYRPTGDMAGAVEWNFIWKRARQCWSEARRPVFIDFGGDKLFQMTIGIGRAKGMGQEIAKYDFIKRHKGNATLLSTVIDS